MKGSAKQLGQRPRRDRHLPAKGRRGGLAGGGLPRRASKRTSLSGAMMEADMRRSRDGAMQSGYPRTGNTTNQGAAMLITFKSSAAPEVMMLDNLAQYLLGIIGKRLGDRGVITHAELGAAIEKLEAAIVVDKDAKSQHDSTHHHQDRHGHDLPVGLA